MIMMDLWKTHIITAAILSALPITNAVYHCLAIDDILYCGGRRWTNHLNSEDLPYHLWTAPERGPPRARGQGRRGLVQRVESQSEYPYCDSTVLNMQFLSQCRIST